MTTYSDGNENMGGVNSIQVGKIVDIEEFPKIEDNECATAIVFKEGKTWGDSIFLENRSRFSNESNDTDQGFLHPSVLDVIIPRWTKNSFHNSIFANPSIIKVTFNNGQCIIMGAPSHPVIPSYKASTGMLAADRNESVVAFSHSAPYPCPFYEFD